MPDEAPRTAKGGAIHNRPVMHPGIKLRHVRVFLDVAERGSLTAAARAQGLTQPALSRALSELEAMLGGPLFRRVGRRLEITEAGAAFRRHAAEGVAALEAGAAAVAGRGGAERAALGVLPTVAARLVPALVLRLRELRPETVLTITTGPHGAMIASLRAGEIDLLIGRMPAAAEMAGLAFEHLYEEEVVLAVRAGHPLAEAQAAELLAGVPLILPPEGAAIRRAVDDYLAAQGLDALRPAVETVVLAVGRGLLLGSDAAWFISRGVIVEELASGALRTVPTGSAALAGSVGLTRRRGHEEPMPDLIAELARDAAKGAL